MINWDFRPYLIVNFFNCKPWTSFFFCATYGDPWQPYNFTGNGMM